MFRYRPRVLRIGIAQRRSARNCTPQIPLQAEYIQSSTAGLTRLDLTCGVDITVGVGGGPQLECAVGKRGASRLCVVNAAPEN